MVAGTEQGEPEDQVCVPITVQNFNDIVAFQYTFEWDTSIVTYDTVINFNPNVSDLEMAIGTNFTDDGKLLTAWAPFSATPVTLNNGDTLYQVCLDIKPNATVGSSALLTFSDDPTQRMATKNEGGGDEMIPLLSADGAVDVVGAGTFTVEFPNMDVCPGDTVCAPVLVADGFNEIVNFQWAHEWDMGTLTYLEIQDENPAFFDNFGFSELIFFPSSPGVLRMFWNNADLGPVTLAPGDTLYTVCFESPSTMSTINTDVQFTDDGGQHPIEAGTIDGLVPAITNDGTLTIEEAACEPDVVPITADASITNVSCNGEADGAIDLTVSGGDGSNYTYAWSNGGDTEDISDLAAGDYSVTITSATETFEETYTVTEPDALSASSTSQDISCNGADDGSIDLTVSGGTTDYTFAWDNGAGANEDPIDLGPGDYTVTITDANGCTLIEGPITISEPDALSAIANRNDVTCFGEDDGSIDLTVSGGTTDYTFEWDNGAGNDEDPTGLAPGDYTVTITDANGCTLVEGPLTINEPDELEVTNVDITTASCSDPNSGAVDITVAGGTTNYSYEWNYQGETTEDLNDIPAGAYFVTITDANDCTLVSGPHIVGSSSAPDITLENTTDPDCDESANGAIEISASGGSGGPYDVEWSNGMMGLSITGLPSGSYIPTVTDNSGCSQVGDPVELVETTNIQISENTLVDPDCTADNGAIDINVSGVSNETYDWSNNESTQDISNLIAGTYTVTVTDNGCSNTASFTLTANPSNVEIILNDITDAGCGGAANGAIDISVNNTSGNISYDWSNNGIVTGYFRSDS